jgi:hypothetical protein
VTAIIDYRAQGGESYATRDKEKIFAGKHVVNRERISIRTSDGDLLTNLRLMKPFGYASALLYGKLHILGIRRRGGYGEHSLADTGDREHRALSGTVIKRLLTVGSYDSEGLNVGRVYANVGNDADGRNQSIIYIIHLFFLQSFS